MRKLALLLVLLVALSTSISVSLAAPAADPACPGSLVPQLSTSVTNPSGHIAHIFSTLRNTPDGSVKQVVFAPATFNVYDAASVPAGYSQPSCVNGVWSWYIQYIDVAGQPSGWASESQTISIWGLDQYWLVPGAVPAPTTPTTCATAPDFRLTPGGSGEIADVYSTLRPAPGVPGKVIYAPGAFNVFDAASVPAGFTQPTCAGGIAYWYIQYTDIPGQPVGWASEGNHSTYWLRPAPAATAG